MNFSTSQVTWQAQSHTIGACVALALTSATQAPQSCVLSLYIQAPPLPRYAARSWTSRWMLTPWWMSMGRLCLISQSTWTISSIWRRGSLLTSNLSLSRPQPRSRPCGSQHTGGSGLCEKRGEVRIYCLPKTLFWIGLNRREKHVPELVKLAQPFCKVEDFLNIRTGLVSVQGDWTNVEDVEVMIMFQFKLQSGWGDLCLFYSK